MKRVHIVGLSPRTGTTLMMELMAHCFRFDAVADHELSILDVPDIEVGRFCSKHPTELEISMKVLERNPELWIICMVRDPRDIISSKHKKMPDCYWTNLRLWNREFKRYLQFRKSDRFIEVRYEDLVSKPDRIQEMLKERIPFLEQKERFSDFHQVAKPGQKAADALGGIREISTSSVGNWRNHLPRVKAQLEIHGDITDSLIDLGYESDAGWKSCLDDVEPDNGKGNISDAEQNKSLNKRFRNFKRKLRLVFNRPRKRKVILMPPSNGGTD
jgi:hypothetical protein